MLDVARPNLAPYGGSTAVGGDPGGYYTQDDYRQILSAASAEAAGSDVRVAQLAAFRPASNGVRSKTNRL
jgi:hypothetical protein